MLFPTAHITHEPRHKRAGRGDQLHPESRCGRIRSLLSRGPMTRVEICSAMGIKPDAIGAYLQHSIKTGRILKVINKGKQQFVLGSPQ